MSKDDDERRRGIPEGVLRLLSDGELELDDDQVAMLKSPAERARFDSCVEQVRANSPDVDPFAVCSVSVLGGKDKRPRLREVEPIVRSMTRAYDFGGTIDLSRVVEEHENGDITVEHQVARPGQFVHPVFGEFELNETTFGQWERNVARLASLGQDIAVTIGHKNTDDAPAAGWIKTLRVVGGLPLATIRLLADTVSKIRRGEYRYWSPEFLEQSADEAGRSIGSELVGGAITNIPFLVGMPPFELSRLGVKLYLSARPQLGMIQLRHGTEPTGPKVPSGGDMVDNEQLMELLGAKTPEELIAKVTKMKALADEFEAAKLAGRIVPPGTAAPEEEKREMTRQFTALTRKLDEQAATLSRLQDQNQELREDRSGDQVVRFIEKALADGKRVPADLGDGWDGTPKAALAWLKKDGVYQGDVERLRLDLERSPRKVNLQRHLRTGVSTTDTPSDDGTNEGRYVSMAKKIAKEEKVPLTEAFALARERDPELAKRYVEESTLEPK